MIFDICISNQNIYLILQQIKKENIMALAIRPIPEITGTDAERFIEQAEAVERNPHTVPLEMTEEEFQEIMRTAKLS